MALFLVISSGIITVMTIIFSSGDLFDLLLLMVIGLLVMPLVVLLNRLLRYLDRWLARQLMRADELLRESPPLPARLVPTGLTNRPGTLVALHPLVGGPTQTGPLLHALINPSFRWSPPPVGEIPVQLYCRALLPGEGLVALQSDGKVLLGKMVGLEIYSLQRRLLTIASITLGLIVLALVGILVVGK